MPPDTVDYSSQIMLKRQAELIKLLARLGYTDTTRISKEIIEFSNGETSHIESITKELTAHKPWEYIQGWTFFDGNRIIVTQSTLIPRVETEDLLQIAESMVVDWLASFRQNATVIDMGTGSGAIIISLFKRLSKYREKLQFIASDISRDALAVARKNISENRIQSGDIHLNQTNLLNKISFSTKKVFIVANLPYIPDQEMQTLNPSVRDYEPHIALNGGEDGIGIYKKLFDQLKQSSSYISFSGVLETHTTSIEDLSNYIRSDFQEVREIPDRFDRHRFIQFA